MATKKTPTKSAETKSEKKRTPKAAKTVPTGMEASSEAAKNPVEMNQAPLEPLSAEKSEAELDVEAEHRMQAESPALPDDSEAESEAQAADTFDDASDEAESSYPNLEEDDSDTDVEDDEIDDDTEEGDDTEAEDEDDEEEPESTPKPRPPAKLERLQKILAQAGVASRRRGEDLITQGRVQVNGKIITELGTKADAGSDHIRVDGKLLHGAERLRYFVLNKPKGFVTTVKDPERRPTVMQFFEKLPERLYPVGRLDYQTEGLLLVTNDGELANKLTKASSGVEKTYLVKVSGQPTEDQLALLRGGVAIEKGKPGEGRLRTAPARIRQVRQGDNPWYEVVLIEGRNRELRKMFEEIGHFVEKIRRVGYGPLVLDQEPGNMRELDSNEVEALRKAADGKLRASKSKDTRRRHAADAGQLPTVLPKPSGRSRIASPAQDPAEARSDTTERTGQFPPRKPFGAAGDRSTTRPFRSTRPPGEGFRPATERTGAAPRRFEAGKPAAARFDSNKPGEKEFSGPSKFAAGSGGFSKPGPAKFGSERPAWKKDDRPARPPARFNEGGDDRRGAYRGGQSTSAPGAAGSGRTSGGRSFGAKPAWNKTGGSDRPAYQRPSGPRRDVPPADIDDIGEKRMGLKIEAIESDRRDTQPSRPFRPSSAPPKVNQGSFDRAGTGRSGFDRASSDRPGSDRPGSDRAGSNRTGSNRSSSDRPRSSGPRTDRPASTRPQSDRPRFDKPRFEKPRFDRPKFGGTESRGPGGPGRSAAPSRSGARLTGAARPPRGESGLARPFTTSSGVPRAGGARPNNKSGKPATRSYPGRSGSTSGGAGSRPAGKTGWKPKPSFGGKPSSGGSSRPSSSGPRSGGKSSPRPGGKKPGPSGGKRY
jgi:23S rRNA pseudouridine2605 synthase